MKRLQLVLNLRTAQALGLKVPLRCSRSELVE
jgi:hypothetical protein